MVLRPRLVLRHTQSLAITPQLQQAIKLLQMSNVQLTDFIEHEIEKNPLLEREDAWVGAEIDNAQAPITNGEIDFESDGEISALAPDDLAYENSKLLSDPIDHESVRSGNLKDRPLNTQIQNVYEPEPVSYGMVSAPREDEGKLKWARVKRVGGNVHDDFFSLENVAAKNITLRDHLIGQVNIDFDDPIEAIIAYKLIDMLDDNGWLSCSLQTVANELGSTVERVKKTLSRCQELDPPGVFGRTLAECLTLQLREKNRLDPAMEILLQNLELLGQRDFSQLRRICGVDKEDLLQMFTEIKELNPRPASGFDHEVMQPVVPDVFVRHTKEGWAVELNNDVLPRVLVNTRYHSLVRAHARSREDKEFVSDRFNSANWLVRALNQRADTILKVTSELVRQQRAFFENGVEFLKPLTLREIAEQLSVHESTVSRVTTNKYIAVNCGIFEMKYFFNSAVGQNVDGMQRSSESVRFRIKTLIEREAPECILSDERIVGILRADGINVARRTVAKYRDVMRIPSSVQRRREKAHHA